MNRNDSKPIRVFDARPVSRAPLQVWRQSFVAAWESRYIIRSLFVRDIKGEYRKSLLGMTWIFLPPLFSAVIWIILNDQQVISFEGMQMSYPVFALCGTVLWQSFISGVNDILYNFRQYAPMRARLLFHVEAILYSALLKSVFHTAVRMLILIPIIWLLGAEVHWTFLLAALPTFLLILLGFVTGLLLVPMASLYDDVERLVQYGLQALFFLTPVIYPLVHEGWFAKWLYINPITHFLNAARNLLAGIPIVDFNAIAICTAMTLLILLVGIYFVKLTIYRIIERI